MYVIIGSHFVTLEGKFILIALFIVRTTLNVTMLFPPVVEVLESLTKVFER